MGIDLSRATVAGWALVLLCAIPVAFVSGCKVERSETPPEAGTTTHGLRELLLKFEAEHPQFSELLGRIADGLSRMGI